MVMLHGTTVSIKDKGVLITGPSGSGKSDLAFRLLDRGAILVSDDQTQLDADLQAGVLWTSAPGKLKGLMEIRGVGIVALPSCDKAALALVVELVDNQSVQRLPTPTFELIEGIKIPKIRLHAFEISAPIKIEWVLAKRYLEIDA